MAVLLAQARVAHPDFLALGGRPLLYLVDDPQCRSLTDGDPLFGWEGDYGLALYIDGPACEWVLVRYCPDGQYRELCAPPFSLVDHANIVPYLVMWLISHDPLRGFDVFAEMVKANEKVEQDADRALEEEVEGELAPRLAHALVADGLVGRYQWGQAGLPEPVGDSKPSGGEPEVHPEQAP